MPQSNRVTKAQKEERINKVYELLIAGGRRYQVHQYIKTKTKWNVATRQIDSYIAEANTLIAAEAQFHREREYGRAIAVYNDLYQRCMNVQDYPRAVAVRRDLNKLLGIYPETDTQTRTGQQIVKLVWGQKPEADDDERDENEPDSG